MYGRSRRLRGRKKIAEFGKIEEVKGETKQRKYHLTASGAGNIMEPPRFLAANSP